MLRKNARQIREERWYTGKTQEMVDAQKVLLKGIYDEFDIKPEKPEKEYIRFLRDRPKELRKLYETIKHHS